MAGVSGEPSSILGMPQTETWTLCTPIRPVACLIPGLTRAPRQGHRQPEKLSGGSAQLSNRSCGGSA
jgi:hypothetical protein